MTKARYLANKRWFAAHPAAYRLLLISYKLIPYIIIVLFPGFAIYKFFASGIDHLFIKYHIVPFIVLIAVTVLRKIIKRQRPYTLYETEPVIQKKSKSYSFPSRHTASAFIISFAILAVNIPFGIVALLLASTVAVTRVLAGVHFISDVVSAMLISSLIGTVFFFIL